MSIDLDVLRKDLGLHKETLQKHTGDNVLAIYSNMFGVDAYVQKVRDYKNGIDQLETILHLFDSNVFKEAFEHLNIKADADELKRKNLSNPKLIEMIIEISNKLKYHKIILDRINLTISD
ncbi:hypothetical protein AAV97_17215 [Acinetobacter sp. Ag2]|uniref:hypothetical protein n=1 Tax=Acinetobacter sp. Ag2 TaxID=1646532 RepID=UPI0006299CA8|nr:hypothetical protein [Acinetobacter sp. Ag2]KKW76134.1 hypothetical protein AAV97_17215 [Acinetobacter sp. Ag2]